MDKSKIPKIEFKKDKSFENKKNISFEKFSFLLLLLLMGVVFFISMFAGKVTNYYEELDLEQIKMCNDFGFKNHTFISGRHYCFNDIFNYTKLSYDDVNLWLVINDD